MVTGYHDGGRLTGPQISTSQSKVTPAPKGRSASYGDLQSCHRGGVALLNLLGQKQPQEHSGESTGENYSATSISSAEADTPTLNLLRVRINEARNNCNTPCVNRVRFPKLQEKVWVVQLV